jgi:hypothetical protein
MGGRRVPAVYYARTGRAAPTVRACIQRFGGMNTAFADVAALCGREPAARLGLRMREVRKGEKWRRKVRQFVQELRR